MNAPEFKPNKRLQLEAQWQLVREARFFTDEQLARLIRYARRMRKEGARRADAR